MKFVATFVLFCIVNCSGGGKPLFSRWVHDGEQFREFDLSSGFINGAEFSARIAIDGFKCDTMVVVEGDGLSGRIWTSQHDCTPKGKIWTYTKGLDVLSLCEGVDCYTFE